MLSLRISRASGMRLARRALKSKPTSEALYPRAPSPAEDTPVPGSRGSSFIPGASLFTLPQPRLERKLQRQRELEKEADVPASQPAVAPLGKGNRLALDIKSVSSHSGKKSPSFSP